MEPLSQQEEKYFLKALKFLQLVRGSTRKAGGQPWPANSSQSRSMGEYQSRQEERDEEEERR